MSRNLTSLIRLAPVAGVILLTLGLGACSSHRAPQPDVVPACSAALCNITQNTWQNHIEPRHCIGSCARDQKSIFVPAYCGSRANAVNFCTALMAAGDCAGAQQPNGRIAYTGTLAANVGEDRNSACAMTRKGTVIYDPRTAAVVTQFPGLP